MDLEETEDLVEKTTISVIKADIGSLAGHHTVYKDCLDCATVAMEKAKSEGLIVDYRVTHCGDDLELIMGHHRGEDNKEIHQLAWNTFKEAAEISKELKLYAAGQDLLKDTFSGNVRGMGPGVAEMEFEERISEPIVALLADKTAPGAFNLPFFRIFADPFCTAGLIIDPAMHGGFKFEVMDARENKVITLKTPEENYDLLALIGTTGRYIIRRILRANDNQIAAAVSTTRLSLIAGKYVGKDDPVALVRAQHGLPSVGEILEAFAFPHLVAGWMRGSHNGPIMPVGVKDAKCTRFDGPPRIVALGFQLRNAQLIGPADMFDDPAFDRSRWMANEIADYMRRHGPFEPGRLEMEEVEYTGIQKVLQDLKPKFKPLD
ncbi:MAG: fructose-1,6-bisphosphate aldolase/phosphatase [Promethearchaeati archaeon SRVP18_Atabeyarchaeia-1]